LFIYSMLIYMVNIVTNSMIECCTLAMHVTVLLADKQMKIKLTIAEKGCCYRVCF